MIQVCLIKIGSASYPHNALSRLILVSGFADFCQLLTKIIIVAGGHHRFELVLRIDLHRI